MRIAFRVEGNPQVGLGHLMRCLALAQALHQQNHQVFFLLSPTSMAFCQHRSDWCGECVALPDIAFDDEPQWLVEQAVKLTIDWLVLDGYQFGPNYLWTLNSSRFCLAIFDDMNNSGLLPVELVINGAPNGANLNYHVTAQNAALALGADFQVLRQEFLTSVNNHWSDRSFLSILFGGSDPQNLTLSVLKILLKKQLKIPIKIITGGAYTALPELQELLKGSEQNIHHLHDCQNMATQWLASKLVISAAGGSQFELLACATPTLLVVVADNQQLASNHAAKQGWCEVTSDDSASASQIVEQALTLWYQPERLYTMHQLALAQPRNNGASNIIRLMQQINKPKEHSA